jgi:hypothetical protein
MTVIRKLTAILLLIAIGLPASLGVGLHLGQADCCHEYSVCKDCPLEHASHNAPPVDRITAPHDCAICEFLAIAKDARPVEAPEVALDLLPIPPCTACSEPSSSGVPLAFLARGPPASLPA